MTNLYERFQATAKRFGDRPAVLVEQRAGLTVCTYAELERLAEQTAAVLAARGVRQGDACAILADNDEQWCAAYLGVLRLGAVAVPLDTAYRAGQLATLLRQCGARVLFTTPRFLPTLEEARTGAWSAGVILLRKGQAGLPGLDDLIAAGPAPAQPSSAGPGDPAVILYTSGTTSDPKGVVLTHGNLLAEMHAATQVIHVDEQDRILGVLPLFHALAQLANLLLPFALGAAVVFLEAVNSAELLRVLREREITAFACVPQFFYLIHQRVRERAGKSRVRRAAFRALLAANSFLRRRLSINLGRVFFRPVHGVLGRRMRILVTGGSRLDPAVGRDFYAMGFNLLQAYGLTESSGAATLVRPGDHRLDSCGQPLPGVDVRILPAENSDRDKRDGEVAIGGPIVMQGYYQRPDATAETLRDGWLLTGDLGYLDDAGRLYITGRKKEVIITSAGKNIYPEEIEAHYEQSPYVQEMCVVGLARPGEPAAERLHAVVVPNFGRMRERKVVNAREVLRYEIEGLSIHLPASKRITSYDIWTEPLPRTSTRKLKRFEIEKRVREHHAGPEEAPAGTPADEVEAAWQAQPEVARALELIRAATPNKHAVRSDANIELDLGLDSLERVELLARLEERFGRCVGEEAGQRIYTVRELVEAVCGGAAGEAVAPREAVAWGKLLAAGPADPAVAALAKDGVLRSAVFFVILKLIYAFARLFTRMRVSGREQLSAPSLDGRAFLICPNHQSYLDPFALVAALPFRVVRRLFFVGASEYFTGRLMRRVARWINLIPVDPDANLLRAMQAGAYGLRCGRILILFPEGERSIDGTVKRFKKGAAILALHLGVPIVPVAMNGVFDVWPRGRPVQWRALAPWGKARIRMRFGAPLLTAEPLPETTLPAEAESRYDALTDRLRRTIVEMWEALR